MLLYGIRHGTQPSAIFSNEQARLCQSSAQKIRTCIFSRLNLHAVQGKISESFYDLYLRDKFNLFVRSFPDGKTCIFKDFIEESIRGLQNKLLRTKIRDFISIQHLNGNRASTHFEELSKSPREYPKQSNRWQIRRHRRSRDRYSHDVLLIC